MRVAVAANRAPGVSSVIPTGGQPMAFRRAAQPLSHARLPGYRPGSISTRRRSPSLPRFDRSEPVPDVAALVLAELRDQRAS